jgi:cytidylate kinase
VATVFARISAVREKITTACRAMISQKHEGFVLDGRDAATTIAPDAELKIYLDAEPKERARRRALEQGYQSQEKIEEILEEQIIPRDNADADTLNASQALAITIDTTNLSIDEQIAQVYKLAADMIKR